MAYTREQFIKAVVPYARRDMQKSGVLASVTIAQAILESGNGNSKAATECNNLFGIKGTYNGQYEIYSTKEYINGWEQTIKAAFKKYPSWQEGFNDHSTLLCNSKYNLKGVFDYRLACDKLQSATYATAPTYAATLKNMISRYNLTQYDYKENVNSFAGALLSGASGYKSSIDTGNSVNYRQRIIEIALKEQGNVNGDKFWSWYGFGSREAWCVCFVSWCAEQAGVPTSIIPKASYCGTFREFADQNGCFHAAGAYVPKTGDIFLFGLDHTGLVVESDGTTFKTIEGNTSNMVAKREHSLLDSRLSGFFSPNYPEFSGASESKAGSSGKVYGTQVLKYLNDIAGQKKQKTKEKPIKIKKVVFKQSRLSGCQMIVFHGKYMYTPVLKDGVSWNLERSGSPGQLSFSVIPDKVLKMEEGDAVQFRWNGQKVFFGFIFEKKETQNKEVSVTCYDQLRYLKNKDTYVYKDKRADQLIKMIAGDFGLKVGKLAKTSYTIPTKIEDNKTLFDMIDNALMDTLVAEAKMYVLYDDFGKLILNEVSKMKVNLLIDAETGQSYSYTTSINDNTYNKVKLDYSNDDTQTRDIYIAKDSDHIKKWGVLQYFEKEDSNSSAKVTDTAAGAVREDLVTKANALLNLYNDKTKRLQISKCFGNINVRAGSSVIVSMKLHDMKISNYMMVEKVKHNFEDVTHTMDLTLVGGAFIA